MTRATSPRSDGARAPSRERVEPAHPVVAVIPLKALGSAKSRLSPALGSAQRRGVMVAMFDHVVSVCLASPSIDRVLVVAGDAAAGGAAAVHAVEALPDPGRGLSAAIASADQHVERLADAHGWASPATLVLAADLPAVKVAEVEQVVALSSEGPCVIIAPTTDGGTGAMLRRPPAIIRPAYGPDSCALHLTAAAQAGVRSARVHLPGLAQDVDHPADLRHVRGLLHPPSGLEAMPTSHR